MDKPKSTPAPADLRAGAKRSTLVTSPAIAPAAPQPSPATSRDSAEPDQREE